MYHSVLLRMKNIPDKRCRENRNTHFMFYNFFKKQAVYEIKWKNNAERGRQQTTIWRMRIACRMPKATYTHTHTGCVIIIAFQLQQWLNERASM
jgi:hypothetical protein